MDVATAFDDVRGVDEQKVSLPQGTKRIKWYGLDRALNSIMVSIYYMLRNNVPCQELGGDYIEARDRLAIVRRAARRIEGLGYKVALETA